MATTDKSVDLTSSYTEGSDNGRTDSMPESAVRSPSVLLPLSNSNVPTRSLSGYRPRKLVKRPLQLATHEETVPMAIEPDGGDHARDLSQLNHLSSQTPYHSDFVGGPVDLKISTNIFSSLLGGNWGFFQLQFGDGAYSRAYLQPYLEEHGPNLQRASIDACFENAAHALVTGVGLLVILDFSAPSTPLMIINLADVRQVRLNGSKFTVKAEGRDYIFNAGTQQRARIWKAELDGRASQARYAKPRFIRSPEYQDALAYLKDGMTC